METTTFNINEIKKELIRKRTVAYFSHYISGNLYYTVELEAGKYQFPIPAIEDGPILYEKIETGNGVEFTKAPTIQLSTDLGTTTFGPEEKASYFNRWIQKAIKKDEFIQV
jgi:hypothetical protein